MMHVLFVDDEPALLRGFERGFRTARPTWQPHFALSGDAALALLSTTQCDLVVSDQSMPGMDGVTLLGEVRARHPQITRVILSGHVSTIPEPRALAVVHQWWGKPRTSKQLMAAIEHALWAHTLVGDPAVRAAALEMACAPSPAITLRAVADAVTHDEVVRAVAGDPALVAKVLQAANASFAGDAQRVSCVEDAIGAVGSDSVRAIARELGQSSPDVLGLADHARRVAMIAGELAPPNLTADARTAGLLHVLGRLVLGANPDVCGAARIAGMLIATWQLPIEIARAVAYHADPGAAPVPGDPLLATLARAVAVAGDYCERP